MKTEVIKRCSSCKTGKPMDSFHRDRSTRDGRQGYCKTCRKERYSLFMRDPRYGTARRESRRAGAKRRNGERPEMDRRCSREYRARHPDRTRARDKLHNAVEYGSLVKPNTCSCCNRPTPKQKPHGHHEDYAKPFEVEWLCSGCHYARTVELRAKGEGKTDG